MRAKKNDNTVSWWLGWIALTIVSFFVSSYFWTGFIARHVGTMQQPGVPVLWVTAVFGSWMVLLVPLIVVMYYKVDKAYEDARIARESAAFDRARAELNVQSVFIEESERLLNAGLSKKLKQFPEAVKRGHLVRIKLRDGREIENVFVLDRKDVLGVYGVKEAAFRAGDIVDVEPMDLEKLPAFETANWLRLDGVGGQAGP